MLNQPFQVGYASLESLDITVENMSSGSDAIYPSRSLRSRLGGRLARRRSIRVPRATLQWGIIVSALYRVGDTSCATATRYIGTITWREIVNGRRPFAFDTTYIELGGGVSLEQGYGAKRNENSHFRFLHESQALFFLTFWEDMEVSD